MARTDELAMLFHTYINYSRCNFNLLSNQSLIQAFNSCRVWSFVGSLFVFARLGDCIVISAKQYRYFDAFGNLSRCSVHVDVVTLVSFECMGSCWMVGFC